MIWAVLVLFYVCFGSVNAEKLFEILKQHIVPSRSHLFQGHLAFFKETMQNQILNTSQRCKEEGSGTGLAW